MVALLELVLDKKELKGISRPFAKRILDAWLGKHPDVRAEFEKDPSRFTRKKAFQRLRSEVRAILRTVYGVFFTAQYGAKRDALVDALINEPTEERARAVLGLHRSSAERLSYYAFLYHQLFRVTGTPQSVLDLGCGFNPFAYPFLPGRPAYHSADIACQDLERVGRFLEAVGVEHSEHCVDLTDPDTVATLPRADVAFSFKLFDSLEELRHDVTAELLDSIPARILVTSFPTLSVGQKKPLRPREWFERLITGKVLGRVTLPNEEFTIITLEQSQGVTAARQ